MKKTVLAICILFFINAGYAQQKTGKYKTVEDYKQKKFSDAEEVTQFTYVSHIGHMLCLEGNSNVKSAKNKKGEYVLVLETGEVFKAKKFPGAEGGKIWGFKSKDGTYRFYPEEKTLLIIIKDAPICLYGRESQNPTWEEDKDGNITKLTATVMNAIGSKAEYYISKTIDGEIVDLNQKELTLLVQDDSKLVAYINSKDYSKKDNISIINTYNATHKK